MLVRQTSKRLGHEIMPVEPRPAERHEELSGSHAARVGRYPGKALPTKRANPFISESLGKRGPSDSHLSPLLHAACAR